MRPPLLCIRRDLMIRTIKIGGEDYKFNASAGTIRRYKEAFKEDMVVKLQNIDAENLDADSIFGIAYVMAADGYQKGTPYVDWLDKFEFMDLVNALPEIVSMIIDNNSTMSIPNSKNAVATER